MLKGEVPFLLSLLRANTVMRGLIDFECYYLVGIEFTFPESSNNLAFGIFTWCSYDVIAHNVPKAGT